MENLDKLLFGRKERLALVQDIRTLLKQDLSPMDIARDYAEFGKGTEKAIGKSLLNAITQGKPFAYGFEGWLDDLSLQTLHSSEKSGNLLGGFEMVEAYLTQTAGMTGKILGALGVPLFTILVTLYGVQLIGNMIFPELEAFMPVNTWPLISQYMYGFGKWLSGALPIILAFIVFSPPLTGLILRYMSGSVRDHLDALPIFTHYRMVVVSQLAANIGYQLDTGKGLYAVITYLQGHSSRYVKSHLERMAVNIRGQGVKAARSGGNLGQIMDTGLLLKREAMRLKRVGSRGQYAELLKRSAYQHGQILDKQVNVIANFLGVLSKALAAMLMLLVIASIMMLAMKLKSAI